MSFRTQVKAKTCFGDDEVICCLLSKEGLPREVHFMVQDLFENWSIVETTESRPYTDFADDLTELAKKYNFTIEKHEYDDEIYVRE